MKKLGSLLQVIALIISTLTMLQAQENQITVHRIQHKTTIEFKDDAGKVLRTLNVEDANPYNGGFQPKDMGNVREGKVSKFRPQSNVSNIEKSALAVSYSVKVFSADNAQLQELGESTLVVYSDSGTELFRQRIEADNAGAPLMAPNAKYVAVPFAGLVHDNETHKIGFSIFDVKTKSLVLDIPTDDIAHAWVSQDVFVFAAPDGGFHLSRTYYVFDTRSTVLYKKSYDRSMLNLMKRFENEGAIFLLPPDGERTEKYETHFTKVTQ